MPENGSVKPGTDWWGEAKAIFWLILAVLAFHSFIAKPFYIPSESMMPGLLKGDRLVVSKYPYGWSWVSPSFHILPRWGGRIWGRMPERGDVVMLTPHSGPNQSQDYIKRVIGLPGDTIEVIGGVVYLNGRALPREERPPTRIPVDPNVPCGTEPGRGDIDLPGALATLPASFKGWIVVEVDVPEAPTNLASTQISAAWISKQLGPEAFTANQ